MMKPLSLPATWALTTLAAIRADHSASVDPRHLDTEQRYELYSVPSFPTGRPEIVCASDIGSTKKSVVPGAVLLCKINPHINRVWVVGACSPYPKLASTEWIAFFPLSGLTPSYLAYFL